MKKSPINKTRSTVIALLLGMATTGTALASNVTAQLLEEYQQASALTFSASSGKTAWNKTRIDPKSGKARSCASCHTSNLNRVGKHVRTGKVIKPMAPSVNPKRLTDRKHVKKWFKRNCKWVFGRECTPQEKGDYLAYLQSL